MGIRALAFSQSYPDSSPGYQNAVRELAALVERAKQYTELQQRAMQQVHGAAGRKVALRRIMKLAHLKHLARVAQRAAHLEPDLRQMSVVNRADRSFLGFRTTAGRFKALAGSNQELLIRYGLTETVLEDLGHLLEQFDQATDQVNEGRQDQVGASAELVVIGREIVRIVRVLDSLNLMRFAGQPGHLAAWASAILIADRADRADRADEADRAVILTAAKDLSGFGEILRRFA